MNLAKLLEYQETDLKLKRIQLEFEKSDSSRGMTKHKHEFAAAKKLLTDSESAAEQLVAEFAKSESAYKEATINAESVMKKIESTDDEAEELELVKKLEELLKDINAFAAQVDKLKKRSEKAIADFQDAQKRGRFHKEKYTEYKKQFDELTKERTNEVDSLRKQLDALKRQTDAEDLKLYNTLASERIIPVLVPASDANKSYSCGGCGMELAGAARAELDKTGICRCESCRRIIYKNQA